MTDVNVLSLVDNGTLENWNGLIDQQSMSDHPLAYHVLVGVLVGLPLSIRFFTFCGCGRVAEARKKNAH